jgi:hypothetical protein
MKENKFVKFVKDNALAIGLGVVTVAGIAVWAITKDKASNYADIDRPELFTGEWALLQKGIKGKYTGCVTGCVNGVDLTDLGNFGDALATIEGIEPHEPIRIIFGTEKSFN